VLFDKQLEAIYTPGLTFEQMKQKIYQTYRSTIPLHRQEHLQLYLDEACSNDTVIK